MTTSRVSGLVTGKTAKLPPDTKPHKFNAVRTEVDGYKFPSKAEAKRYGELKALEEAGKISELILQPRYELASKSRCPTCGQALRKMEYVADFAYTEDGRQVVEDVKGVETPTFKLKRHLFLRLYRDTDLRIIK